MSDRPRLLDLFCGAGGAAMGYHRAGFDVVGVDIKPQPHYPFEFVQADALEFPLDGFAAIHASPPCQRWSMAVRNAGRAHLFPDLIAPIRQRLVVAGVPYVIENVDGAPLMDAIRICGAGLDLGVGDMYLRRHRRFECSFPAMSPGCACGRRFASIGVYGNGTPTWHRKKIGRNVLADEWREAMGCPWMVKTELKEAIPPAYTEHIGYYLMLEVTARRRRENDGLQAKDGTNADNRYEMVGPYRSSRATENTRFAGGS